MIFYACRRFKSPIKTCDVSSDNEFTVDVFSLNLVSKRGICFVVSGLFLDDVSERSKYMKKDNGSALLITIFIIALMSALVMGMLQMNTEEILLMGNHIYASQAVATAEAGLNDAFAEIRTDDEWTGPITNEPFNGGSYDVTVTGTLPNLTIVSLGTTSKGFVAKAEADVTIDTAGSGDHAIRIDNMRINE